MSVRLAVLAWRLGLGWLLGRRWVLLTTQQPGDELRRAISEYRFYDGNFYLESWPDAAATRAMLQAHPGPLGVRMRPATDRERTVLGDGVIVLEPTGEPVPALVEPDLLWVWGLLAAAAALIGIRVRAAGRRHR